MTMTAPEDFFYLVNSLNGLKRYFVCSKTTLTNILAFFLSKKTQKL